MWEGSGLEESIRIALGSVERSGSQMNSGLSIILVLRGEVALKTPGQNRSLTQSHYAVINHNDVYILDSTGPNVFLWVSMDQPWLEFVCPEYAHGRDYRCSMWSASGWSARLCSAISGRRAMRCWCKRS